MEQTDADIVKNRKQQIGRVYSRRQVFLTICILYNVCEANNYKLDDVNILYNGKVLKYVAERCSRRHCL